MVKTTRVFKLIFVFSLIASPAFGDSTLRGLNNYFAPMHDHGDGGKEPAGSIDHYMVVKDGHRGVYLRQTNPQNLSATNTLTVVMENATFSNYHGWDINKRHTGIDVATAADIAYRTGFTFVEIVTRPWMTLDDGRMSLLAELDGRMNAISIAGASINAERIKQAYAVGPTYKAGKVFLGDLENSKLHEGRLLEMMSGLYQNGYEALRGLTIVEQDSSSIRGQFFERLAESRPNLIHFVDVEKGVEVLPEVAQEIRDSKLVVFRVQDYSLVNKTLSDGMNLFGKPVDLIMADTGSLKAFRSDQLIQTQNGGNAEKTSVAVVSQDFSNDPKLGAVFGLGDGVFLNHRSPIISKVEKAVADMLTDGTFDRLLKHWFDDTNKADTGWVKKTKGPLYCRYLF